MEEGVEGVALGVEPCLGGAVRRLDPDITAFSEAVILGSGGPEAVITALLPCSAGELRRLDAGITALGDVVLPSVRVSLSLSPVGDGVVLDNGHCVLPLEVVIQSLWTFTALRHCGLFPLRHLYGILRL